MMPFFQKQKQIKNRRHSLFAPLQVRIPLSNVYAPGYSGQKLRKAGKRALSWVSRAAGQCEQDAGLTVEAALCLPLFLFFAFCLMMPMRMMDRQRQIQAVLEQVGEDLSRYGYLYYCMEQGDGSGIDEGRDEASPPGQEVFGAGARAYVSAAVLSKIDQRWVEQVSFQGTHIGDNMVHIVMEGRMKLPFSVFRLESIPMELVCSRRMWVGAEGNRAEKGETGTTEEETIVYIGKASNRYHVKRDCHYLYNETRLVPAGSLENLRNQEGKRYYPCDVCGSADASGGVYVMPYGTSYHTTKACSAITAYVQAVPLKQAEHLGVCSYCGGL